MEHNNPKGPNWFLVILAALMLGGVYLNQARKINMLSAEVNSLQQELFAFKVQYPDGESLTELYDLLHQIERDCKEAHAPLVYTWNVQVSDIVPSTKTILLNLQVGANSTSQEAQATVVQKGVSTQFPLSPDGFGNYSGTVEVSLANLDESATLLFSTLYNGEKRTETLKDYEEVRTLLPLSQKRSHVMYQWSQGGKFTLLTDGVEFKNAVTVSTEIWKNDLLLMTVPLSADSHEIDLSWQDQDEIKLVFVAQDEWGLTYRYQGPWYDFSRSPVVDHQPSTLDPALIWPEE